jgi:hypothetical protein
MFTCSIESIVDCNAFENSQTSLEDIVPALVIATQDSQHHIKTMR